MKKSRSRCLGKVNFDATTMPDMDRACLGHSFDLPVEVMVSVRAEARVMVHVHLCWSLLLPLQICFWLN